MKKIIYLLFFTLFNVNSWAGELLLQENKGQFPKQVLFKAPLNFGALFIEKNKLTFVLHNQQQLSEILESVHHKTKNVNNTTFSSHSFSIEFENANINSTTLGKNPAPHYYNYFIGDDPLKWASEVKAFKDLWITNLYPGIDFHLYGLGDKIKYEFVLHPGSKVGDIQLKYTDTEQLNLKNNNIQIVTSVGNINDEAPVSYYKKGSFAIPTKFKLNKNIVTFQIAHVTSPIDTLILDPALNFSSFTGSFVDNFGFTATYDNSGNAYAGGIAFGTGYPTSTGAFQTGFAGGTNGPFTQIFPIDISISKFSSNGQNLLYSTYLGGNKQECPHSMVVTENDELIVFGTSSSLNFPTGTNAYDKTFNGGTNAQINYVLAFEGSDIIVTKFNANGTNIIGSTYFGGSANDGFNDEQETNGLHHNYSDVYRGEVITDANGNAYIASSTSSSNLPIVSGFQTSYGGGAQDGCIAKFNSDLSQLIWSSYIGGTNADAVYGLQNNSVGDFYITGGTKSSDFPGTSGGFQKNNAGQIDGFVSRISQNGATLFNTSYIGSNEYDQSYFVQIDSKDKVYVYGQTIGSMPISNGVFSNPNSGQFIQKYSSDLSTLELSTLVGSGSGNINLVPSAFLVDNCGKIYISGWGGETNSSQGGGTTNGMPISSDAHQKTTDGSDFYLMFLGEDFSNLNYSTYYGSLLSSEHVDGGTSRFDKDGIVYQAVCAACGASAFPTTPSAYATSNNSSNCNLAVIKFDVTKLTAVISPLSNDAICSGDTIFFNQESNGGESYKWIFEDGTEVNSASTWKIFPNPGNYRVTLVAYDPKECPTSDTTFLEFTVKASEQPLISISDTVICFGETINITTANPDNYIWSSNRDPQSDFVQSFSITPDSSGIYTIDYKNNSCTQAITFPITVLYPPSGNSQTIPRCDYKVESTKIPFQSDYIYTWNPSNDVEIINDSAYFSPTISTSYQLNIDGTCGSIVINYDVNVTSIIPSVSPDTIVCSGAPITLTAGGGDTYFWTPNENLSDPIAQNPIGNLTESTIFNVAISKNGCTKNQEVDVKVFDIAQQPVDESYTIQFGGKQSLELLPQFDYTWTPDDYLNCNRCNPVISEAEKDITYFYSYTDSNGCRITDSIQVNVIYDLYVPNAFTPNGDGLNDVFYAYSTKVKEFHMEIYNRWGEIIFESTDLFKGWNGEINKREAQIEVYVWKINYTKTHTKKPIEIIGTVTLVR